ncbi:MAG TPA: tetratricopeptide repeat protein [Pyrinomonadaceae bacterium]|nr:tetratricopeptide repeat protein [Pyrinomonadaceae bacterium]
MPTRSLKIDTAWKKAALAAAGLVCVLGAWAFGKWGMASSAAVRADDRDVALFLTELAPDDPQTHYTAAVLLLKSFDEADTIRGLQELETAAHLAPENYMYWLELGQARERSGDRTGGETALRRALELAPSYARVHWALGNALLRNGRTEEAFVEIRKAVVSDPSFADTAATTAWIFLDADMGKIRARAEGLPALESALVAVLVREKRFDEALDIWNRLPAEEKKGPLRERGNALVASLLAEKKIRYALGVFRDVSIDEPDAGIGRVSNGGFESAVRPTAAGPFEWQIAPGLQPQIVLSNGERHSGNNSLLMVFNSSDAKDFRGISQLIPVEPDAQYELEIFYHANLKLAAALRWVIVDADGKQIASAGPIRTEADWSVLRISFRSPATSDGITLWLTRDNCGPVCAASGRLWFDDVSLRRVEGE